MYNTIAIEHKQNANPKNKNEILTKSEKQNANQKRDATWKMKLNAPE